MKKVILFFAMAIVLFGCERNGNGNNVEPSTSITILDVSEFETNENNFITFQVQLTEATDQEVTLNYATDEDTAEENDDFIPTSGTLTFSPGTTSLSIDVEIVGDESLEPDEQFFMVISNVVNAKVLKSTGTATIRNEDTDFEIPEDGYATPEAYGGYTLVWQDEFDGNSINTGDWTHEMGAGGWGNQELQHYTANTKNSYISEGNLVIEAIEENFEGAPYTSARMITKNKQDFQFGRVDIRAILPEGQGIWPALWMLGDNIDVCLLYTSPSPRDRTRSRMPSSA